MNTALIVVRSVHFAATTLAAGGAFFIALVLEPEFARLRGRLPRSLAATRQHIAWVVWASLAAAVVSSGFWLAVVASNILGASIAEIFRGGDVVSVVDGTRFGLVWSVRLAISLALAVAAFPNFTGTVGNGIRVILGAALLGTLALVGHAGAAPGYAGQIHFIADVLHLVAAGLWVGALLPLALLLLSARENRARSVTAYVVRRFSFYGMIAVAVLLASGLVNAWFLVGSPDALFVTTYGRLVALKIALFIAMVGIASINRFALTPRLREAAAARALSRNSLCELALALGVMLVVGALGTMPPAAHVHFVPTSVPADAAFVHIHTEQGMAEVTIEPGRPGPVHVTIRLLSADFSPLAAKSVEFSLGNVKATATPESDGIWQISELPVPSAGTLTVTVTVTTAKQGVLVLDAPIVIER